MVKHLLRRRGTKKYPTKVGLEKFIKLKLALTNRLAYSMKVSSFILSALGAEAGALA
jgi:hypothetical protein